MRVTVEVRNLTVTRASQKVICRAIVDALRLLHAQGAIEVSVALMGTGMMRRLHRAWKKKDRATDVLSFGLWRGDDGVKRGEIALCIPIARQGARQSGTPFLKHLAMLSAHGAIHLFGLDHDRSEKERVRTERIQDRVLADIFVERNV